MIPVFILDLWKKHFQGFLNEHAVMLEDLLLDTKIKETLRFMKPAKTPEPENKTVEFFSHSGLELKTRLTILIQKAWEKTVLGDFKNDNNVMILNSGAQSLCRNSRGITLLRTAGKIFARILLNRLLHVAEEISSRIPM